MTELAGGSSAHSAADLLAAIVESSDDAIVSKTMDGTILSWNAAAERMYGYAPEEAIGRDVSLIVPADRRGELESILRAVAAGERVEYFDTVRIRKDGTRFDVSVTISPVRDASGTLTGASAIARDISERKQFEAALRGYEDALERTCAVLEHAERLCRLGTWIVGLDDDEQWLFWSSQCYRLFGVDEATPVDLDFFTSLMHPDDRDRFRAAIETTIREHQPYEGEHRVVRPDGTTLWTHVWADVDYDNLGRPVRLLGVTQDITREHGRQS